MPKTKPAPIPTAITTTISGRIYDDIRRQIEAGTLPPGATVPSARQIAKRWKVALATAIKVQKRLHDDGLVRAVPGVGTIVAKRARHAPAELDLAAIVGAAVAIADCHGLAALSMRAVAGELGVATMALYRHVPGKDELLLAMMDAVFAEATLPTTPPRGWRARLVLLARLQWRLGLRHPWLPHVLSMARPQLLPNAMAHTEWVLRALDGTGLDLGTSLRIAVVLAAHVRAHAIDLEPERQAVLDSGLTVDEWMASQAAAFGAITRAEPLPMLSKVAGEPIALDPESVCFFGLELLLDGIARLIAEVSATDARSPAASPRRRGRA